MSRPMHGDTPRKIHVLQDHPYWMPGKATDWNLHFLSWGVRRYGRQPVPAAMHDGWVYVVVMDGTPVALVNGRRRKLTSPRVLIVHPDCVYGWTDRGLSTCRVLCWEWASPPAHASLCPAPAGWITRPLKKASVRALERLHAECVSAVAEPDDVALLTLRRARLDLDIALLREVGRSGKMNPTVRFNLARRYILRHPACLDPVAKLCEYLQVSPATLKILFHQKAGMSPRAFALNVRMEHARSRLTQGAPVKEVAYELGYRHPNDFSRAFARLHRKSIRAWLATAP